MWQSHKPGTNVLPLPSITCALAGTVIEDAEPTAVMTLLLTTTV